MFCLVLGMTSYEGVYFSAYFREELRYILLKECLLDVDEMLYNGFLGVMLNMFMVMCRNLYELCVIVVLLWV